MTAPLLSTRTLVVPDQPNWLVMRGLGQSRDSQVFPVHDGDGNELGRLEPTYTDTKGAKVFRLLFSMLTLASTARGVRDFQLVGPAGSKLLDLRMAGTMLEVYDAGGDRVGTVLNSSRSDRLTVDFHVGPPRKRFGFYSWGKPAATISARSPDAPYEFDVVGRNGPALARAVNDGGGRNVVELNGSLDPALRMLVLAFGCALLDRFWLALPRHGSGGD